MAQKPEVLAEIEALSVHCRPPLMEANARTSWLTDWCSDLAQYPIEAIRVACRKWRQSGSTKFPTPGQLLPLVRESVPGEKAEVNQPWSPASDEQYRAMSVREKIREHLILAHEAFTKAGPMFRNTASGGPITKASGVFLKSEDMPPSHRHWTEEGRRHAAEAARLREYINGDGVARMTRQER